MSKRTNLFFLLCTNFTGLVIFARLLARVFFNCAAQKKNVRFRCSGVYVWSEIEIIKIPSYVSFENKQKHWLSQNSFKFFFAFYIICCLLFYFYWFYTSLFTYFFYVLFNFYFVSLGVITNYVWVCWIGHNFYVVVKIFLLTINLFCENMKK